MSLSTQTWLKRLEPTQPYCIQSCVNSISWTKSADLSVTIFQRLETFINWLRISLTNKSDLPWKNSRKPDLSITVANRIYDFHQNAMWVKFHKSWNHNYFTKMRFSKLKIIRCCEKVDGFCVLPQSTIGDRELSFLSCGILMRILSLDDGDDFTISGFSKDDGVDIRSLRKVLKELEEKGYYKKGISTNKNGREIGVYHIFYDGAEAYHNKVQICTIKEKPSPHTPYKKKYKEEYILSS